MAKYAGPDESADTAGRVPLRNERRFSVRRMARLLNVSRSGYYAHATRAAATVLAPRRQRRADLEVKITQAHQDSGGTYGSPRITAELRDQGEVVTAKTVAKIMAGVGLEGISPRTFKVRTTVVDPAASFPPDLVGRHFDRGRTDAVWLTDITYLTCGEGDMFLCAIRDGHSRKVLGYSVSDHISAEMVTAAIDDAVAGRGSGCRGTILHSDRGGEFTANVTAQACFGHGLRRSMGETGICWDNSPAESFWSTFKHEEYYRHVYATKTELVAAIDKWLNFYNSRRRHSSIGMLSPNDYEKSLPVVA
ncbi:integrase catalytic subunit [Amycolatopsis mediterranei S699]|uniref:Integrase catalytic subunit n=4 Tax=Amycolatopsis mediterranei TaxID=33910 RepID=A0A0H3DIV7_AMYMU|nr:IS3 family transposase [Amycolatopsis mediterranei]ADJ43257.1 integrase catalytic subunit [Amycolatopsis mediterranei U32]ADJ43265.1 integrase catalytic subunit [Amycolatopsis mediterranei U32]ADJ47279.1 integrase catalytic subunit [Amycolatopsis mediterranei U32]ADJ47562.1 integrase catalytic subunit [Amycolatopsis mediterranei U32]ADJ49039.1 integrase catalytic subunit [Amycolatopsis mediterranei U32]